MVKGKWQNLRDKFKKELKKIPKGRSGDDGDHAARHTGSWCHFHSMLFLQCVFTPRPTQGNIVAPDNILDETQTSQMDFDENETGASQSTPNTSQQSQPSQLAAFDDPESPSVHSAATTSKLPEKSPINPIQIPASRK